MTVIPHYINGAQVHESGTLPVFNPATGEVHAEVPVASPDVIATTLHSRERRIRLWTH